ncbi:MAG TPA: aldose 1-epimerase family protein [Cytophagales bacterium]
MATLENEFLKVSIRPLGAELTSIQSKRTGQEHLWQADPAVWNWHAPNLFPTVGESLGKELRVGGQSYPIERHGFARKSEFALLPSTGTRAVFSLRSSKKTLAAYPYRFEFQVAYALEGHTLTVTYRVLNEDSKPVYFAVGGHPAFRVPLLPGEDYADYYLEFEADTALDRHLISGDGYFTGHTRPVPLDGRKLHLTKDLFNEDALVFKNLQSRRIALRSTKNPYVLTVSFPAFPYLGIWAKPAAPFVCIEPWLGCADTEGKPVAIEDKELIQSVAPGGTFEAAFTITIS